MKLVKAILTLVILLSVQVVWAQHTQTIRGTVIDKDSKTTLPGASIVIVDGSNLLGTTTDFDGAFIIEKVPIGRVDLKVSFIGYEDKLIPNILLNSAKQMVLDIELIESLVKLDEVVVKAEKGRVLNEMALISSRSFSIEETKRYAGSLNDPARMATSFAGVSGDPEGDNTLTVRGNSSTGVQWRLEGIEIPNPNHFSNEGATGGPINTLNSDMLANSDFYTGAFAPEFGNAYSGIFDMKLRTGNNQKHEYALGISSIGLDAAIEGPIPNSKNASYLFNYRYSSLSLLDQAGIVNYRGVPKYQDLSFKINVPTKNAGTFSLFGLGGISTISQEDTSDDDEDIVIGESNYDANMGVFGLNHLLILDSTSYLKTSLSLATNGSGDDRITLDTITSEFYNEKEYLTQKTSPQAKIIYNKKFNAKNRFKAGLTYTRHYFNMSSSSFDDDINELVQELDTEGDGGLAQAFISWKHRFNEKLTIVGGLHYLYYDLNNTYSIEPRIATQWELSDKHSINAGFGVHSRLYSLPNYYSISYIDNGAITTPNTMLELPKARHYVLGHDYKLNKNIHFKTELYYQDLYDVAVEDDPNSTFSLINTEGRFVNNPLSEDGTGRNYGVEFTLERYFANNYYFLGTASLYESKYTAKDGVERNTRFNGNYVFNFLAGKDFLFGENKQNVFSISAKFFLIGGRPYTDIAEFTDTETGEKYKDLDYFNSYAQKSDDVFQINFSAGLRINKAKTSHEIKLDVQNLTNNQAKLTPRFNRDTGEFEWRNTQLEIIPNIIYRIYF